jgi:nucleoside phosphorylase
MYGVDVVVVTALPHEYEAAVRAASSAGTSSATAPTGLAPTGPGVSDWVLRDGRRATPYRWGRYVRGDGSSFTVAIARATRMGLAATASVAACLVERLRPRCLAMCGVCAGNPDEVALGDVIVADLTYLHDEGKCTVDGLVRDHRQLPMPDSWVRAAQDLSPHDLPSYGDSSPGEAMHWFLNQLWLGVQPCRHPAWRRYFTPDTWTALLDAMESAGLLEWTADGPGLTDPGLAFMRRHVDYDGGVPQRLPFAIAVGPMASGAAVVNNGRIWQQLAGSGVRNVLGVDLEAAGIAAVAHRLEVPTWAVVKGVADHADVRKDDRYLSFAATASAEVLWRLLAERLPTHDPDVGPASGATMVAALNARQPRRVRLTPDVQPRIRS